MSPFVRLAGGLAVLSLVGCSGPATVTQLPPLMIAQVHEARAALETQELAQPIARDRNAQRELLQRSWTRVRPSIERICTALQPIGCKRMLRQMRPVWIEDESINAWANDATWQLGIHTGLLAHAGSEDEVAFTLAHEAAHLILAHGERKASTAMDSLVIDAVAGVAIAAAVGMSPEASGDLVGAMAESGYHDGYVKYSPQMELEADQFATYAIADAGYDIPAAAQLVVRLFRHDPAGNSPSAAYRQTHPGYGIRLAALHSTQQRIAQGQTAPRFNVESYADVLVLYELTTHAYVPRLKPQCEAHWRTLFPRCEWWKGEAAGFLWTTRCPVPPAEHWAECLE